MLRILDVHCKLSWCCRLLSSMLLLTIDNQARILAAAFDFIVAPLAPTTMFKTPFREDSFIKSNTFLRQVDGQAEEAYTSLRTAGGGNCGIHAVVGSCTDTGTITAVNPRTWVADLVQDCVDPLVAVERLSVHVGAVRAHQMVHNILLAGHCHPLLEEAISANPTSEALLLRERLLRATREPNR